MSTKDPLRNDYFSNCKYTLEEIKEYQAPEKPQMLPKIVFCNYSDEGFKEITSKEWGKKTSRIIKVFMN